MLLPHHQGQVTAERITAFLASLGVAICKRPVVRRLTAASAALIAAAKAVLRAGLASAPWITVDDTVGRSGRGWGPVPQPTDQPPSSAKRRDDQLGDDRFTVFATSCSKSRRNFLEILRAGHDDDVLNAAAVADMAEHGLAGPVIDRLALHPSQHFADRPAWPAHLEALGLTRLEVTPAAGSQGRPPVVAPERRAVNRRRALGQHP